MCVFTYTVLSHLLLYLYLSPFSDSEGCLLLVATNSSSHTGGQCCVHSVSHCSQGAQLFSQSKAASSHPSGAHHSQLTRGHTLWPLFMLSPRCSVLLLMLHHWKSTDTVETSSWISISARASAFVQFTAKRRYSWLIIRFTSSIWFTRFVMIEGLKCVVKFGLFVCVYIYDLYIFCDVFRLWQEHWYHPMPTWTATTRFQLLEKFLVGKHLGWSSTAVIIWWIIFPAFLVLTHFHPVHQSKVSQCTRCESFWRSYWWCFCIGHCWICHIYFTWKNICTETWIQGGQ